MRLGYGAERREPSLQVESSIIVEEMPAKRQKTVWERSAEKRLRAMYGLLSQAYGPQHWWPAKSSFEVILGAYLTQNTAWKAVERSLENLRGAQALTVQGIRSLSVDALRALILPSGFCQRKAPSIKAFVAWLDAEFGGSLASMAKAPTAGLREKLLALPGVGPETADAILLYALGHAQPMADEYLRRIVTRHRLIADRGKTVRYEDLVTLTRGAFAADPEQEKAALYNEFHALTVAVGKAHCGREARCTACPLACDLR